MSYDGGSQRIIDFEFGSKLFVSTNAFWVAATALLNFQSVSPSSWSVLINIFPVSS